jgi:ArsR family transcriptional regulator
MEKNQAKIKLNDFQKTRPFFRAINHKIRVKILEYLQKNGESNVTSLYTAINIGQPAMSMHLAILRKANVVTLTAKGKERFYQVNSEAAELANDMTDRVITHINKRQKP